MRAFACIISGAYWMLAGPLSVAAPEDAPATAPATAEPKAAALFAEGIALREAGDQPAACVRFDASARLDPRPASLAASAACREVERELSEAVALLERAADLATGAEGAEGEPSVDQLRAEAARIRSQNGLIVVDLRAIELSAYIAVSIDGRAVRPEPGGQIAQLLVAPGEHRAVAVRPSCGIWSGTVAVAAGQVQRMTPPALLCADDASGRLDPVEQRETFAVRLDAADGGRTLLAGKLMTVTGIGVGLFGMWQWGVANSKFTDAEFQGCPRGRTCRDPEGIELLDGATSALRNAKVAGGLGIATTLVGFYIWHRARTPRRPIVQMTVTRTDGGALLGLEVPLGGGL